MKKNSNFKIIIFYIVLFAVVIVSLSFMFGQNTQDKVTYGEVVGYFKNDQVSEFVVDDSNYLEMKVYVLDENGNITANKQTKVIGYQLQSLGLFVEDCSEYYKSKIRLKSQTVHIVGKVAVHTRDTDDDARDSDNDVSEVTKILKRRYERHQKSRDQKNNRGTQVHNLCTFYDCTVRFCIEMPVHTHFSFLLINSISVILSNK